MRQLCSDSSCSYSGRSVLQAVHVGSAGFSNESGDKTEVSRGRSTVMMTDYPLTGRAEHQPRRSLIYLIHYVVCVERKVMGGDKCSNQP